MPIYARNGVRWAWLLDPLATTLEVHVLGEDRRWSAPVTFRDADVARAAPFDAIALELSALRTDLA